MKSAATNILPGASSLGFGINVVTAQSPRSITQAIVLLDEAHGTVVNLFGTDYLLPANVSEIPIDKSSLNYSSFTSESQFSNYMSAEASVEASGWGFSAEFDASYSSLSQGDETNFYGLVESNVLMWSTQLKSVTGMALSPDFVSAVEALPAVFSPTTQQAYFSFFDQWGTHIINQAQVGGSLHYCVTSNNQSGLTEQAAAASMHFEYDSLFVDGSASAQADWNSMSSSWIATRNARLDVVGGSPQVLAKAIIPTDPTWQPDYSSSGIVAAWTDSILQNPAVTGISLTPISNVLSGFGASRQDVIRYQTATNQMATALAVYLNAPISVNNTSVFQRESGGFPILVATSSSMAINETVISPPVPPRLTDLSLYWLVMVDQTGTVQFNHNLNSEDPDDFDQLVESAIQVSDGQVWWVGICIVNQVEAPLGTFAVNWLQQLGIDPKNLTPNNFYPGMSCVVTMISKTNCSFGNAQINFFQPDMIYFGWDGGQQEVSVDVGLPIFVGTGV